MDHYPENADPLPQESEQSFGSDDHDDRSVNEPSELRTALADARSLAREQVLAAWQLQLDRVREQLEHGWRDSVERIFDERFAEIEGRLAASFDQAVTARAGRIAEENSVYVKTAARRDLTDWLNQTARRLRQAEGRDIWIHSLLDAAATFSGRTALFLVSPRGLKLEGARGAQIAGEIGEIPTSTAPAFANAIDSKDTVVSIGSPREISETVASVLGVSSDRRVYLFPIVLRQNAIAVLYAEPEGEYVDVSALELLVSLASSSIETTETVTVTPQNGSDLIRIAGAVEQPKVARPSWSDLSKSDQELHLKAQRFARTAIAQLLLHKLHQVRAGRASNSLYGALKNEIDAGREAFRNQFIETCPSMVDYFHQELVRTLAKDSADALGPGYPGPIVG